MTSEPGSITSMPRRWPAAAPFTAIRLRLIRRVEPSSGDEDKGPDPVTHLGAIREHPFGVEDLHPHPGSVLAAAQDVPDLEVLPLRVDPIRAMHVEVEQVLDPVIGVGTRTARSHLHQPRPNRRRPSVDPDRSRPVLAPGVKWTLLADSRDGPVGAATVSMKTSPVNHSLGPAAVSMEFLVICMSFLGSVTRTVTVVGLRCWA